MALFHKTFEKDGTETYLFYPGEKNRTAFKRRSVTVLMDNACEESVRALMAAWDMESLAMEKQLILCFPVAAGPKRPPPNAGGCSRPASGG